MKQRATNSPFPYQSAGWQLWHRAILALQAQGTWRAEDAPLLHQYVRSVLAADHARADLDESGLTSVSADGRPVAHPLIKVARDAEADARAVAADLLLTPASRRRAGLDMAPDAVPPAWMSGVG